MENIFLHLCNLSITASYIVLAVILLRFLLFKTPKWINCLLWAVVGLRLAIPFSIESIFSLIPSKEPIPSDIMLSPEPQINTGISIVNNTFNPIIAESFTPEPSYSVNPLQVVFAVASVLWIVGVCAMLLWGLVSYLRLRIRVAPSLRSHEGVYICDGIDTPFILGMLRPRIYLPSTLSEQETDHVISHEKAHITRLDQLWKPLGFLLLSVYWFNPLLWVAYILFCRDIEKACDERVIRGMEINERRDYSSALLACSTRRISVSACPLAFGEVGVKSRIKSILNYKKSAFWIIIVSIALCVALAICFLTVPQKSPYGETDPEKLTHTQTLLMSRFPEFFGLDTSNGLDIYFYQMAPGSFTFGLTEHTVENLDWLELMEMKGTTTTEMRHILATYGKLPKEKIYIIPWQNPLSSYIGPYFIGSNEEELAKRQEEYKALVYKKLFSDEEPLGFPVHDTAIFDMDGDGIEEHCALGYGTTSGLFTFTFSACEFGKEELKYYNVIYSQWYRLSFVRCEDGVWRVQGITQGEEPQTHLFDISVVDGNVHLTENGVPIGEIAPLAN